MGGARSLSREVCHGIRTVLSGGPPSSVSLSRRARVALQSLRDELCISAGSHFVVSKPEGAAPRTWTFAGTRANRTYARHAAVAGAKVRFDALSVQAPASLLTAAGNRTVALTDDELAAFAETVKFSACLPPSLLSKTVVARNFDAPEPD